MQGPTFRLVCPLPPPPRPLKKQVLSKGGVCFKGILHLRRQSGKDYPARREGKKQERKKQHWMVQNLGFRFHVSQLLSFLLLVLVGGPPRCCYSRLTRRLEALPRPEHGFLFSSTRQAGRPEETKPFQSHPDPLLKSQGWELSPAECALRFDSSQTQLRPTAA